MVHVYQRDLGRNWFKQVCPNIDLRRKCQSLMSDERRKRPGQGHALPLQTELDFTTLGELIDEIAAKRWGPLEPALGTAGNMLPLLRRLKSIRDPNAHSREPLPYETNLALGISGEVRQRVTTYMSTQAPSGEYYPRIEMLRDSFGNEIDVLCMSTVGTYGGGVESGLTLRPGDVVTFDCRGSDPDGRVLSWDLISNRGNMLATAIGDTCQLVWTVTNQDVAAKCAMKIFMNAQSIFHRFPNWDCRADFFYEVRPPSSHSLFR